MNRVWLGGLAIGALFGAAPLAPLAAQEGGCQLVDSPSDPPRRILQCPSGVHIEAETTADVSLIDPKGRGRPSGARIGSGAALIEVPHGYPGGFQILAPRAVASVRGTVWAMDVLAEQTSVLGVEGHVAVRRAGGGRGVVLGPGEGVDVRDDGAPLKVVRWAAARAAALLARLGR